MMSEHFRPTIDRGETPAEGRRSGTLSSIKGFCEGATIGSPKIVALTDLIDRYYARANILETSTKELETPISIIEGIASFVAGDAILRGIGHKKVTVEGYAEAFTYLAIRADSLKEAWERIFQTEHFPAPDSENPIRCVANDLRSIRLELTQAPGFRRRNRIRYFKIF